jgi:hypothetical protein
MITKIRNLEFYGDFNKFRLKTDIFLFSDFRNFLKIALPAASGFIFSQSARFKISFLAYTA